jgi:hypothetical protein
MTPPVESVTVPEILESWAHAVAEASRRIADRTNITLHETEFEFIALALTLFFSKGLKM